MLQNELGLSELVNIEDWQKIQETFSEILGLTLRTIDIKGNPITRVSGPNRLQDIIPQESETYSKLCTEILESTDKVEIEEPTSFKAPFDLDIYLLPIKAFGERVVAYIIVRPIILNRRKTKAEYADEATKINVDLDHLMDILIDINVYSHSRIRSINKLLTNIFSHMAQTGYHKKRLGEIGQEVVKVDPLFSRYYEERILNALLKSCTLALDADSGSVMTTDKKTNHLHIKVASKLDENIIKNTDVEIGEGIAGLAAASAKAIVLPRDQKKNNLSKKMKRNDIRSSMVVPFNKENEDKVYGVINLNIVRKKREFTQKDIALVKELINFAGIALSRAE